MASVIPPTQKQTRRERKSLDRIQRSSNPKSDRDQHSPHASHDHASKLPANAHPTASERRHVKNLSYWAIGWLTLAHLVVLAAPFYFSWTGLAVMLVLHWMTGSLGICLGYHRLLTHTGMKTYSWVRYTFATIGTLAGEGSALDWVADHRKHHAHSDHEGDPHSPHEGGWWAHIMWLAFHTHNGDRTAYLQRWVPDLYKQRGMRILDMLFLPLHIGVGCALYGIGYAIGGVDFGLSLLIWGMFVRLVGVLHATWMVNSASHMWGYKNYETTDDSRNNWLVAIVAYGEGWHNNHHAYPRMAKHGHKWWEFDITWQAIRLLRACGLVWDVVDYRTVAEKQAGESAPTTAA
ncbi:Fatty acid desaturase [Novipirellula galeiformis]|uniref:Fatty acid desaturase n=1 Tax=Novipirellula galeiformis TaxID=2528004 RepID=A0A5C6C172_9BACT|nr:acyl-CoA desaturase [Novipirellula galeiformis]TWU17381.1 Fatty acid desaturase [Novipirellula galeiformis]